MSFREKHLWIGIFSMVVVWAVYFRELIARIVDGGLMDPRLAAVMGIGFVGALFVVAVVEGVLTLLATLTSRRIDRKARDEREIEAALKASHAALMILIFLVASIAMIAWVSAVISPALGTRFAVTPANAFVLLANVLIGCVVLAELARAGLTIALIRGLR